MIALNNQLIPDKDFPLFLGVQTPALQAEVARDARTPVEILDRWSTSSSLNVLHAIVNNPNTASHTLEALMSHADYSIQGAIARHRNTPVPILRKLFDLQDSFVDDQLVRSPNLSDDLAIDLLHRPLDERQLCAFAANETLAPHIIEHIIGQHTRNDDHLSPLARRQDLPPHQVRELYRRSQQSGNTQLQTALSERTDLLPEDFQQLIKPCPNKSNPLINHLLARNPAVPLHLIRRLFNEGKDHTIWEDLCSNPACPNEILETIAKRTRNINTLKMLCEHPHLSAPTKVKLSIKYRHCL